MKQLDIFGNEIDIEDIARRNGNKKFKTMQELHGLTENKTCKNCKHCRAIFMSKTYYKCGLWRLSHSEASDIRLKDKACGKYEE